MTAARKRRVPTLAELRADFGPSVQHAAIVGHDGTVLREARLEKEFRPDPENPNATVRGARRRDPLGDMLARGHVKIHQVMAAERFRDDLSLAEGARDGGRDMSGIRSADPTKYDVHPLQLDAMARVRAAWLAIGLARSGVVGACVVGRATVTAYAAEARMDRGRAAEMLRAALDDLDRHYDRAPGRRFSSHS